MSLKRTGKEMKFLVEGVANSVPARLRSLAVMALIAVSVSACGYNVIPAKEEAAKAAWAEVQNQYQRRPIWFPISSPPFKATPSRKRTC